MRIQSEEFVTDGRPVECLGMTFPNDEKRRKHFLGILREKLKDPEFHKIEGLPIGLDENILACLTRRILLPTRTRQMGDGHATLGRLPIDHLVGFFAPKPSLFALSRIPLAVDQQSHGQAYLVSVCGLI